MKTRDEQIKRLEELRAEVPSKWRENAELRVANREWIRESQRIATAMLVRMDAMGMRQGDLAKLMGVSQQYISKILRGKENLTLTTIVKIEETLNLEILSHSHIESERCKCSV
ncbi:helix-turn-helix transcriptional regulator [Parabacteroides sp. PF5-6]|uniref:helix-turn-helix domain-containing protein n=1 Tax=Parabacteroides sp. PF5-6 TaxID=1742403 RepID=UPI002406C730|nr:helix-turn-helix transcriptional regulator [Parabacteroides sp. PF5-6]MDF9829984.1 antitoxin component HigA of HigAB toxin-antitoxin module [Parabacteroides sp. PF5-6]